MSKPCEYCSGEVNKVYHEGKCPKVKTIDYYLTGAIRRVEFFEEPQKATPTTIEKVVAPPTQPEINIDHPAEFWSRIMEEK